MDNIPEKLVKFKFPILIVTILGLLVAFFIYLAPSFVDVIKYFWPLLVSTALFLVAIVVFGRISPPHTEAPGDKPGEGILDYVAGQPDNLSPDVDGDEEGEAEEAAQQAAEAEAKAKGKSKSDDE